ncbi:MAG: hypothetical protein ILP02_03135, partial [Clostridia bacterium]|nr:hypothetical protein [Clostridia bacterium]
MAVDASDKKRGVSFFKPLDIIVYALIALLIVVFSVSFIVGRQPRDAFEVLVGDSKVMEYDFDKRLYTVFDDTRVEVISETEFKITAKGGYNVVTVYTDLKDA